ncbi:MAG: hypothetical protein ACXU8U_08605 [Asticcacaulis sp.]
MKPHRLLATTATLAAVLFVAGCADKDPSSPLRSMETGQKRVCLMAPVDTKVIDDSTLLLIDRSGQGAMAKMSGACLIDPTAPTLMQYHGTTEICGPMDVEVSGGVTGGIPMPCVISSITPLSRAQAQAYRNGSAK